MIEIDGSMLEGGGQILRTSVALSALMAEPIKVTQIRAKRDNPGLQAQQMAAVEAVAMLVDAEVKGLEKGSSNLEFHPKQIRGGQFRIDIGTAGSISLVLQALAPVACFAPTEIQLELTGGTDVPWSPTFDYLGLVFLPTIQKMGSNISAQLIRRGHYPRGGGIVRVAIRPIEGILKPIKLDEFGVVESVRGVSHASGLPAHVASRQADAAKQELAISGYKKVEIEVWYKEDKVRQSAPGSGIALCAMTTSNALIGSDSLGEKGKPAEDVGSEAARKLIEQLNNRCPLDANLLDMLIPYVGIADGTSALLVPEVTLHAKTNMAIAEKLLGIKFDINESQGQKIVSCDGIALRNSNSKLRN